MLRALVLASIVVTAAATPDGGGTASGTPAARQRAFLVLAENGLEAARAWWNPRLGWYDDRLGAPKSPRMPLAYLWSAFPLFETVDAVAIAAPSAAHRAAVRAFAAKAERYWNPKLEPGGGFAYYPGTDSARVRAYFDDNGWWGIAFLDAYRATGDRAYLGEAARAFRFIVERGWDPDGGGIWWDTAHGHKTAEPLAAAVYIGAALYQATGGRSYLDGALKLLHWADRHSWDARAGLYTRSDTDGTLLDYVEGMMIGAHLELCQATGTEAYCRKAEALGRASLRAFPVDADWSATADGLYLRFLLDLYRSGGNRALYQAVYANAERIIGNARTGGGLYMRSWSGQPVAGRLLRTDAGSIMLLAWLATTPGPAS